MLFRVIPCERPHDLVTVTAPDAGVSAEGDAAPAAERAAPGEVELKLSAPRDALDRLAEAGLFARLGASPPKAKDVVSRYYDTPDRRLFRRGAGLRVRRMPGPGGPHWVQTLKTESAGAGLVRGEWEVPITGPRPEPAALTDPAAREVTGLLLPGDLEELFTTQIRRQATVITGYGAWGSRIELCFDSGRVTCALGERALDEIELELLSGDPADLYRLAGEIAAVVPVRLNTISKARHGHRLVGLDSAQPVRAVEPDLAAAPDASAALDRVVRAAFDHWLANEDSAFDGTDPEGVHQLRVALRRLRAALTLFAPVIPDPQRRALSGEVKWLADALGPARDADVLHLDLIAPVAAKLAAGGGDVGDLDRLMERAARAREVAHGPVRAALRDPRYGHLQIRLGLWLESRAWLQGAGEAAHARDLAGFAARCLDKRHRQVKKRGRGFADLPIEAKHALRISVKKLRYAVDFFRTLYPKKRMAPYLARLKALQEDLGHLNDVAVAEQGLARLTAGARGADARRLGTGAGIVTGWYARELAEALPRLDRDWQDFAAERPFWRG